MLRFSLTVCLLLLCLTQIAKCWSTSTTEICHTRTGKATGFTTTITKTKYRQYISTATRSTTVSLAGSSTTTTSTETSTISLWPGTDYTTELYTTYITYGDLDVQTSTLNTTRLVTETQGSTTSTIPTPAGFTPIGKVWTKVPDVAVQRMGSATQVVCTEKYVLITTITSTVRAPTTATTIDRSSTMTISTTKSTTTTLTESSDLVITTSATSYVDEPYSTTTTTTRTHFVTDFTTTSVPTATAYAACASNNVISSINSTAIYWISGPGDPSNPWSFYAPDAYSCCAKCFETVNCTGAVYEEDSSDYFPPPFFEEDNCNLYFVQIQDVCNASALAGWTFTVDPPFPSYTYYVSNGPCGQGDLYVNNPYS